MKDDILKYDSWSFGDSPELADELLALVLAGKKTSTSCALKMYEQDNVPIPKVGQQSVVFKFKKRTQVFNRNNRSSNCSF